MLEIKTEFRRGIFFVRLEGSLVKNTVNLLEKEVTNLIESNGFKNIVFNVEKLNYIDLKGINALFYNYEKLNKNKIKLMMCGINNENVKNKLKKSRILNYMHEISDEFEAFNLVIV